MIHLWLSAGRSVWRELFYKKTCFEKGYNNKEPGNQNKYIIFYNKLDILLRGSNEKLPYIIYRYIVCTSFLLILFLQDI